MRRHVPILLAALAGALSLVGAHRPGEARPLAHGLIAIESGTLPIILSAPHGGTEGIPGVPERTKGTRVRDDHTGEVAALVAAALEKELHARPALVRAYFHRKFCDANRRESEALEDEGARPVYAAYHEALRSLVDDARTRTNGRALLVDIHGQKQLPDTLVRGTRDGKTVKALLARAGEEAVVGSKSVFGALGDLGYKTDPPRGAPFVQRENPSFEGGYIVATYGSHAKDGIDAIQIEIGRRLREDKAAREKLARDLAAAIAKFHRAYLEKPR